MLLMFENFLLKTTKKRRVRFVYLLNIDNVNNCYNLIIQEKKIHTFIFQLNINSPECKFNATYV